MGHSQDDHFGYEKKGLPREEIGSLPVRCKEC